MKGGGLMNVSQGTINGLYDLIGECFQYNRWFDRFVSVLGVKFACNQSANLIHQNIAHFYSQLSDKIGERCLERYNIPVEYASTDEGKQDYATVSDMIKQAESKVIDFQNMFSAMVKIAWDNDDINIYTDLSDLLRKYNIIVEQLILLNDKIGYYTEQEIMKFDHDIDKFWIIGEEGVVL